MMKKITHSPLFWIISTILSGFLYYFSFYYFPKTFPLISLSISMDLEEAMKQANIIAQKNNLGPIDHHSAAAFNTDSITQTFIELEGGGKEAFVTMMEKKLYMPYTWQVRHFKEFEKNETLIRFTPEGTPYGFKEVLSEDLAGAQLTAEQAQTIAETLATQEFNIDFNDYKRVEASQKEQPSKRIDHTFVYERMQETIAEGFYRLQLCVSGDKLTEVTHFVKVPEAFIRRYTEMRSANNSIAWAALLLMGLLYILGGCGIGLYILIKLRWEMWKQPFKWSIVLAGAQALTQINQLPSLWMYYYNAYAIHTFLIQLLLSFFTSFLFQTCVLTIILTVAEGLTRRAFGNHPQLWSLWLPRNASSYVVLGKTWTSYLYVSVMCAFIVAFYFVSTRYFNWWVPSEVLFNPNILATYVPWFSPIAQSLNAGFMEECLFRAIPLASAALLGNYYKKRNLFIGIAFVLQAVIFGAAHANYPTQPAYGRLIELLVPSFLFGALYLRFGLLPGIIAHAVYDLIWFSLPIFVSTNSHALFSKIMIIIAALFPLLIIIWARVKQGYWQHFDETYHNKNWQPRHKEENQTLQTSITVETHISSKKHTIIGALSCVAIIGWFVYTPLKHNGITIHETQQEIIGKADTYLKNNAIELSAAWQKMPLVFTHYTQVPTLLMQHLFVWQNNKEIYPTLLNTYLQPAHWTVRYAQFEGDLIQRTEEYKIMFYDAIRCHHQLPESLPGASLTKEQAREIAHNTLDTLFNLNPTHVEELSAQELQLPHRKNWLFTFADKNSYQLEKGQARIDIVISGDQVTDYARTIHVPEEWERAEQNNIHKLSIISLVILLLMILMGLMIFMFAHKNHLFSYAISTKTWGILFYTLIVLFTIYLINSWPSIIGIFNTSEPWNNQLFQRYGILLFGILLKALGISWICAYTFTQLQRKSTITFSMISTGYGVGIIIAACLAIIQKIMPQTMPLWPDYSPLSTTIPFISAFIQCIISYISITAYYMLGCLLINYATEYGQKHRWLLSIFLFVAISLSPLTSFAVLPLWIVTNTILGLLLLFLYMYILRYNSTLIPLMTGSLVMLYTVQQGIFNAYPHAWLIAIMNICTIGMFSFSCFKKLNKK